MYALVLEMCTDAATIIYRDKVKSFEKKMEVCKKIAKEMDVPGRSIDLVYDDDTGAIGFDLKPNLKLEPENEMNVCMYLQYGPGTWGRDEMDEEESDEEENSWKISCDVIRCDNARDRFESGCDEMFDFNIDFQYGEDGKCRVSMIEEPINDDDDSWQEYDICRYAISGQYHLSFGSFYREYCRKYPDLDSLYFGHMYHDDEPFNDDGYDDGCEYYPL